MKKKFLAIVMASAVALSIVGCGSNNDGEGKSGSNEKVTLKVCTPQEDQVENGWLPTMCEEFKKENPNVEFEFSASEEGKIKDTVPKDVAAAPDVFLYANDNMPDLLAAKALSRLGGETEKYVRETNSEAIVNSVSSEGGIYGIPFTSNTWFMIYDKSAFDEEDVKSLDRMIAKEKIAFPLSNTWYVASFYLANDCKMFEDGTKASAGFDFSSDKATPVTEYLTDLAANPNFMNDDQGTGLASLRKGEAKAMFSGSWDCQAAKEALKDNFAVKELPCITINGEQKQMRSFAGSKAIGVNAQTKHAEIANKFAKFLGSEAAQKKHYELRQVIPCNTTLLGQEPFTTDLTVVAQNNTIEKTSFIQPFIKEMGDYWQPMEALAKGIANKEIKKDDAKAKTEELNTALNKNIKK